MEQAVSQLQAYLDGDHDARIECDEEGELYRLFHTVNSMAAVLNAHADNELREKELDVYKRQIENRADDVCRAKKELQTTPVYLHSAAYAKEHGELEQYRASNNVNLQCKEAIEAAVRKHFDGMYLSHDAAKGVIETYGMERVAMVLANTVQLQNWDGRYSRRNKEWAKKMCIRDRGRSGRT